MAFWQSLAGRWCSGVYERQRYLPPGALWRRHVAGSCLAQPGAPATCGPSLGADSPPSLPVSCQLQSVRFFFSSFFLLFFFFFVAWECGPHPMWAPARLFCPGMLDFHIPLMTFLPTFADVASGSVW